MSYKTKHLLSIFFVENTRRGEGYACVFRLDYQQNLFTFIYDSDYLKWYYLKKERDTNLKLSNSYRAFVMG